MKRAIATAQGEVQGVAYRDTVLKIARKLNIKGYVENLKPYDVRIVAEGEEDSIDKFLEEIKIKRYPIFVEDIKVEWKEAKNEFEYFEIKRGDWKEEMGERMDIAGKLLYRSVQIGEENLSIGRENLSIGRSIKEDTKVMRNSLKTLEEIYKETLELRVKYDKLEMDVELIKEKLLIA